jgi:pimeloyl-ACP methyl ester carboxylesterase
VLTEELVEAYSRPGAFTAALNWYRSGSATLATALSLRGASELPPPVEVPTTVLWGAQDPIYPRRFADSLDELFPNGTVRVLDDVGHFTPLEAAGEMAGAVREFL